MTEAIAPAGWYPDVQIPELLRWWDGCTWTAFAASVDALAVSTPAPSQVPTRVDPPPARIPELAPSPESDPCPDEGMFVGRHELEEEVAQLRQTLDELGVTEPDQLWMELVDLNSQIPAMRYERDQLRIELVDLERQIPTLSDEREQLLAVITPLRAEVTDLRSKQQELTSLQSEIHELRHQKSSLDRELLSHLRESAEEVRSARTKHRFHDS